jgi:hypothetical protein
MNRQMTFEELKGLGDEQITTKINDCLVLPCGDDLQKLVALDLVLRTVL